MAVIDSSIPLGVRPMQVEQPMNQLAKVLQIRGMQQQSELGRMKMDEYRRGIEDQNALRSALSAPGADPYNVLLQRGKVKEATDYLKGKADVGKTESETQAKKLEIAHKRLDIAGQAFGRVRQAPTLENANMALDYLQAQGIYPPEQVAEWKALVASNPAQIASLADQAFRAALSAKDQLPKFETRNTGQTTDTLRIDPVSGQVVTASRVQNTASPGDVLQAQTSTANNQRSVGAAYANAAAVRETANATRDAARIRRDQDTEMKLADDYRAQSKPFKEVADAYKIITSSLDKATTSPAATLAGATKFMKLLDPGSVVRESELGMALAAAGVLDRAANYYNTLQRGKVLTPKQAQDFKAIAGQIYKAAQDGQKQVDSNYERQATQYGLRKDMIVQDLGQNTPVPVDLGSLPSAGGGGAGKPRELQWGK